MGVAMADSSWDTLMDDYQRGYEQAKRELKEVDLLIQQTSAEVERFVQANTRAVARTRQLESVFDTVPRDDIKKTYDSLIENQQRLFTMRGQLEKLQSDQKQLGRIVTIYQKALEQSPTDRPLSLDASAPDAGSVTAQAMVINIIEAQEQERFRLSRQMHDGPAQALTNLVLQAEICERLFDRDPERARAELAELKKNVVSSFRTVKEFIFDLRPMMLDDLGMIPTVRRYVQGITDEGYGGLSLLVTGKERRLARHQEVTVFRIIQALIHIARDQGQATNVTVSIDIGDDRVKVVVEDNGIGFDVDDDLSTPDAQRLSLSTLRERAEMLSGQLQVHSAPGTGAQASFYLPVSSPD